MDVLFERCAGLDVHKQTIVACRLVSTGASRPPGDIQTFGTTTAEILRLSDWLSAAEVTHVAMESTGVYWKPIFNLLEGCFTVWVLNAQHVKNVPGRKTDVKDAQWLADLLRHGLVRPSFIPPQEQRDLRELTRERTNFVRQRATLVNRVQKVLEAANIKLGTVASDVLGVSGRAILEALAAGEQDPQVLAELARGRLRTKRAALVAALQGQLRAAQRFLLSELLGQIAHLEATIARFDEQIGAACAEQAALSQAVDAIPGVGRTVIEVVLAEIGPDVSRFPTAGHLAAWAGVAPGNNESAGRQRRGRARAGNPWLRAALIQAAVGAAHSKDTYLAAQYRRIAARRGHKRALVAVAHSIVVILYHMLTRGEPYQDLGADYFERRNPEERARRLVRQGAKLGYQVTLTPLPTAA
jgi:transposase